MTVKGSRYIFTTYDYLKRIRFDRLKKICSKIFIVANKKDLIPLKLVRKTHKWQKKLKWYQVDKGSGESINNRLSYLLGRQDLKAEEDIEFIILSDDNRLDPIVSSLKAAGRTCHRIGSSDPQPKDKEPVFLISPIEAKNLKPKAPKPVRDFRLSNDESDVVRHSARITLEKLQSEGHRPENLETLKHYIHLFQASPGNVRASIDQVLEYMVANRQISIKDGFVKYNF